MILYVMLELPELASVRTKACSLLLSVLKFSSIGVMDTGLTIALYAFSHLQETANRLSAEPKHFGNHTVHVSHFAADAVKCQHGHSKGLSQHQRPGCAYSISSL